MYPRFMQPYRPRGPRKPREPQKCYSHCGTKYTIEEGDTIDEISSKFRADINDIRRYNLHIRNLNHLIPGDVLCIPTHKPYCSFLTPTDSAPKDAYVIIAGSKSIYVLANLPPIEDLDGDFGSYYAYAISPLDRNSIELSCISKDPSIWLGQIHRVELTPLTNIYISANNTGNRQNQSTELVLFEST